MDADRGVREARKKELLQELAELAVQDQVEEGLFLETPHYSIIERVAMNLGRDLSRQTQERAAREVAANSAAEETCPCCHWVCAVTTKSREVISLDGAVDLTEGTAYCKKCRRSFFPSARRVGV